MRMSRIFAGMSAVAISVAAISSVSAGAYENNSYVNATGEWTYTYTGEQIAKAVAEKGMEFGANVDEDTGVTTYTLGGNMQLGHVRNAKVTMQVTSTTDNIVNGFNEDGTVIAGNSDYLYTVQTSWNSDAPSDDVKGVIKYSDGTKKYGATEIKDWDSGPTKFNGQWVQCMLTDDDLDAITITVTVVADENSTWEYHTYDSEKSEEDNEYSIFRMFGSPSTIYETIGWAEFEALLPQSDKASKDDTTSSTKKLSATAIKSSTSSTSAIKLNWKKVSGATGYRIFRYDSKTKKYQNLATIKKASTVTYKDTKLKAGTAYKYKIKAYVKNDGKVTWSSASGAYTAATKPATVKISKTASSKTAVKLTWGKVTCTGYTVQQYNASKKKWVTVKNIKAGTTSYKITGLKKNTSYKFRVSAYTTVGSTKVYGAWSSTKTVKTTK